MRRKAASSPAELAERLIKLLSKSLKGSRSGEVDAIHDVRVSSRRLQEWLRGNEQWIGSRRAEHLGNQLKRVRKAFQKVRDLDVLRLSLAEKEDGTEADVDRRRLWRELKSERDTLVEKARKKCDTIDASTLIKSVRDTVVESDAATWADRFNPAISKLTQSRLEAIRKFTSSRSWTHDIHQLRLHAKRLRYSREWMCWDRPKRDDELLKSLADLQEHLGDWNDHLVAARIVARWATGRKTLAARTETAESWIRYAAHRLQQAERLRKGILRIWPNTRTVIDRVYGEIVGR